MVRTYICECGAEYVVEEGSPPPPSCRFCHGRQFHTEGARTVSAPPRSWQEQGPIALDILELQRMGGRRVVLWSLVLLAAFLFPRQVDGDLVFSWQIVVSPGAPMAERALAGVTLGGAAFGLLFGLSITGFLRGVLLLALGSLTFLLGGAGTPAHLPLIFAVGALIGAVGASLRIPRTAVSRISSLAGGVVLLVTFGLVYRLKGAEMWTSLPLRFAGEAAAVLTGAGALAVLSPISDRICRSFGRIAFWASIGILAYVAIASFGFEGSAAPFFHLGLVLTWCGFFFLGTNGLSDLIVATASRVQAAAEQRARREEVGFLQRYNPNAVFGSERRR